MSKAIKTTELPSNQLVAVIGHSENNTMSLCSIAQLASSVIPSIFYPKRIAKMSEITGSGVFQFGTESDLLLPDGSYASWAIVLNFQTSVDRYRLMFRYSGEMFYQFNNGTIKKVAFM